MGMAVGLFGRSLACIRISTHAVVRIGKFPKPLSGGAFWIQTFGFELCFFKDPQEKCGRWTGQAKLQTAAWNGLLHSTCKDPNIDMWI